MLCALFSFQSCGITGRVFVLISSLVSNRQLQLGMDGRYLQEYPVNAGVSQGTILGTTLFLLYTDDLPDDAICNTAIYAYDTTLYSNCDQVSDLWQKLELASELKSDLRDVVDWEQEVVCWKTKLVLFDQYINTGAIDVKMDGSVLEEK